MDRQRSIVLLSGGMDSATTLFIAGQESDVVAVMFFDYVQRGMAYEYRCSRMLASMTRSWHYNPNAALPPFLTVRVNMPVMSGLLRASDKELSPDIKDDHGLPASFVPARNLIFLSYAAAVAYTHDASLIYGGWVQVDSDYPDCRDSFLVATQGAINTALGHSIAEPEHMIEVCAPLLMHTKSDVVEIGTELGVPWEHTRSCYENEERPCLQCDSCLKRAEAFLHAGQHDPLVVSNILEVKNDETI